MIFGIVNYIIIGKHCGDTRINNNYSPTTNNNQNFIDIFADVHTDVNFSIVNLGDAKFANKKVNINKTILTL